MSQPTYRLSTYDPDMTPEGEWGWNLREPSLSKWDLRRAIRKARGMGYDDDVSILVERNEP